MGKRFFIIAGEASGDLHGSNLIKALKLENPDAQFAGFGGELMQKQGLNLKLHYHKMAFMGFVEVLFNLRSIFQNIKLCKESITAFKPDVVICIDYPGFNMRILDWAKQAGYKTVYYISPQIWAWKQNRVHKIAAISDKVLCILPFEKDFYAKFGYTVDFVGHPLLDAIQEVPESNEFATSQKPIIALLPGSRRQEIETMLPVFLTLPKQFPNYNFVLSMAPSQTDEYYANIVKGQEITTTRNTYKLLKCAHAAVVTSGTATLETGLFGIPQVVCYKGSAISYTIARKLIKVKYISLVNLILDRELVPEMIQADMTLEKVSAKLEGLLDGEAREKQLAGYGELFEKLGGVGASENAAKIIQTLL